MTTKFSSHKNIIHVSLYPFIQLFNHKHNVLDDDAWREFVRLTKESVENNPEQYVPLGDIDMQDFHQALNEIFEQVLQPVIAEEISETR